MRGTMNGFTSAVQDAVAPRTQELRAGRDRLADDFRNLVSDVESVLRTASDVSRDGLGAARTQLEQSLRNARLSLSDTEEAMRHRISRASHSAGDYVSSHPVGALVLAAAVGAAAAYLLTRRGGGGYDYDNGSEL